MLPAMWTDVVDLRDFYASGLGQVARRMVRRRIRGIWPDVSGLSVLGLGYGTPYLAGFRAEAARVVAAMPAGQGVIHWPEDDPRLATLVDEFELPFPDLCMDRVMLVHALECAEQVRPFLREVWRVMADSGRLLVITPNRRGMWARAERTPFGHGHPYSRGQLSRLLRDNLFTPLEASTALYVPPLPWRLLLSAAPAWERVGRHLYPPFSGVVMMEATKQIYAATPVGEPARRRLAVAMPGEGPRVNRQ